MVGNLRRRSMLEETSSGSEVALYPLPNYDENITNGNHVKLQASGSNRYTVYNLHQFPSTTINNLPTLFTVPAGSTVVLKVTNIQKTSTLSVAFNFKVANSKQSANFGTGYFTDADDKEVTRTVTSDEQLSCLFVSLDISTYGAGSIECDVYFYVDGVRYI